MSRFNKGFIALIVFAGVVASSGTAHASSNWEFSEDSVNLGIDAVSPHVERTNGADRVWYPSIPSTAVADCNESGICTAVSGVGRLGSDFTAVTLPNGSRRAYFVEMVQGAGTKTVMSAACTTSECLTVGSASPIAADVAVSTNEKAWGVPDAVVTPEGKVRVYLVVTTSLNSSCPEKVRSYISDDGISFTQESGFRLEGGFVDTEVIRAKSGDWLMMTSTGPGCGNGMQQLFVTSSTDGLTWSKPQVLTKDDKRRLDPTGYEVAPNVFRIYYSSAESRMTQSYQLRRGTLKIGSGSSSATTTATAKVGAACTKAGAKAISDYCEKECTKLTCKTVKKKLVWSK
jgi:hypothetical protein